jgi:hypothetical protein
MDERHASAGATLAVERSRKYIAARTARLMDDLQCADFEAEAALMKRIAIGFPVYFESLREKHIDADRDILESRAGACRHPYDGGRISHALIWLAENLLEWREGVERQLSWETGDFCICRDGDAPPKSTWDEINFVEVKVVGLRFKRTALIEAFSLSEVSNESLTLQPGGSFHDSKLVVPATNKGGRPLAADWELAALEIAGRYYRGDFKPQTIADVGRELASWLGDQDLHPSDSVVRIHSKRIFEAFQAWEQE